MQIAKRIFLFMVVNLLIILTISTVVQLLGLQPYLSANGINYEGLLIFCALWGFAGSFISLFLSKTIAKWSMGVKIISPQAQDQNERWLVQTVHNLARKAQLPGMPEVGIYQSPDVNAFATGATKGNSLVAVSTGLLSSMSQEEAEGVLGHEIAHIANGDMVTMTLLQGVVNTFVMFFARIAAWSLSNAVDEDKRPWVNFLAVIVFEIALGLLGMMVVAAFSRYREFRADAGGSRLAGKDRMINALRKLQKTYDPEFEESKQNEAIAAFKISGKKKGGLMAMLATHPPLSERIQALERAR